MVSIFKADFSELLPRSTTAVPVGSTAPLKTETIVDLCEPCAALHKEFLANRPAVAKSGADK